MLVTVCSARSSFPIRQISIEGKACDEDIHSMYTSGVSREGNASEVLSENRELPSYLDFKTLNPKPEKKP